MTTEELTAEQVEAALAELGIRANEEYGCTLEEVLGGPKAEQRLQRLAGVVLKRRFADPQEPYESPATLGSDSRNPTEAKHSWHWEASRFEDPELQQTGEYALLDEIRGEWTWKQLQDGADGESGLFWILGTWIRGRLGGDKSTLWDRYHAPKSPEVELAISVVDLLPITGVLAGVVGLPVLAVNLALIVIKFGYEKLADPPEVPDIE